jgi:TolB-like protein
MFLKPAAGPALKVLILLLTLLLGSCALFREPPVVLKMAELPLEGNVCRIAVLPFTNQTEYNMADTLFNRVFVSELIEKGHYLVAQEGDIRRILLQMRVLPGEQLSSEQIRAVADRLGAQIVISGAVLEMRDKIGYGRRLDPSLAVVLRIMEAASGRTLWVTYNRAEGRDYRNIMHFGVINSVATLAQQVSVEILKVWENEGLKECTE